MKLSDIAIEIKQPFDPKKNTEELRYIGLEHISPKTLHIDSFSYSSDIESLKYRFNEGDILFGTMRPYFKKIVRVPFDGVCSTEISTIRAKNETDTNYIFYLMAQDRFIDFATLNSNGDRPRTKWSKFSKFQINHDSEDKRFKIGEILSAYDDLIDTNRRRMQLLEEATRLLFCEWFVYFRFPGHEKVKIVDGVPEGWRRKKVKDLGIIVTGKTPSTKNASNFNGAVPFIKTPDMHLSSIIINTEEFLSETGASSQNNKFLPSWSILVSCIGTVGVVAMNLFKAQTNQQINSVIPRKEIYRYYSFFCLSRLKPLLEAIGGGSTMANVNKNKFENLNVLIPSENILKEFHETVDPLFKQIAIVLQQNQKLARARDLLLPKLMKGEIRV